MSRAKARTGRPETRKPKPNARPAGAAAPLGVPAVAPAGVASVPSLGEIGLNQFAPYLLNRLSAQWNAKLQDLLKELGLSTTKFRALAVLTVASGITVNELAVFAVTEQSTMSRTLDALEDQDLIRRRAKAGDMRVREVFITQHGVSLFASVWPDIHALYARIFAGVDEAEFRTFLATLQKVMRNTRDPEP